VAATVTGPIFQGGRLIARYHQALVSREEARLVYVLGRVFKIELERARPRAQQPGNCQAA
jgi:hypothetical protein